MARIAFAEYPRVNLEGIHIGNVIRRIYALKCKNEVETIAWNYIRYTTQRRRPLNWLWYIAFHFAITVATVWFPLSDRSIEQADTKIIKTARTQVTKWAIPGGLVKSDNHRASYWSCQETRRKAQSKVARGLGLPSEIHQSRFKCLCANGTPHNSILNSLKSRTILLCLS